MMPGFFFRQRSFVGKRSKMKHISRAVASKSSTQGRKGWKNLCRSLMIVVRACSRLVMVKCVDQALDRPWSSVLRMLQWEKSQESC